MKTVAAISFRDNHSMTMDIEQVSRIEITAPTELEEGVWCCELLIRTANGIVALNMLADEADQLQVVCPTSF